MTTKTRFDDPTWFVWALNLMVVAIIGITLFGMWMLAYAVRTGRLPS